MAHSEKIVDYARELYFLVDDTGKKKYSILNIADKITKKYKKYISYATIKSWIRQHAWEAELQLVKNVGMQKALAESNDKELTYIDLKSNDIADRRITSKRIMSKADQLIERQLDKEIAGKKMTIDLRTLQGIASQRHEVIQNLDGVQSHEDAITSKVEKLLSLYSK